MTTVASAIPCFMNIRLFICYLSFSSCLLALHNFMRLTRKQWVQPARSIDYKHTDARKKEQIEKINSFIVIACIHAICWKCALCIHCGRLAKNVQIFVLSSAKAINLYVTFFTFVFSDVVSTIDLAPVLSSLSLSMHTCNRNLSKTNCLHW